MTALTKDRNTGRLTGDIRQGAVAASTLIFMGALVMRNAGGYLLEGQEDAGLVGCGVAIMRADNGAGANGDVLIDYRVGTFHLANSAAADAITAADIGAPCYAVDDQTVARTDDDGGRSIAGFVEGVDDLGVWVRFDEAQARSHAALTAAIAALA